jgi:hypothetical protein
MSCIVRGHLFGGFDDVGVAGGQRVRKEPERDHRGKVERGDHCKDSHGKTKHLAVDIVRAAGEMVALLQDRHPAGDFAILQGALDLRARIGK